MTDSITHQRLLVEAEGSTIPLLTVPVDQLAAVTEVLQGNNIPFWVEEDELSINGGPFVAFVNLDRETDAETVQRLLDNL